ncbi:hypothetical protein T492DRAFT_1146293, partial [Pavlovales sp. CCMP2436]
MSKRLKVGAHQDVSVHVGRLIEVGPRPASDRPKRPARTITRVEFSSRLDCKKTRSVPVGVCDNVFRALGEVSHVSDVPSVWMEVLMDHDGPKIARWPIEVA